MARVVSRLSPFSSTPFLLLAHLFLSFQVCALTGGSTFTSSPTHYGHPPSCRSDEIFEHWGGSGETSGLSCNPHCHPPGNVSSCPTDKPSGVSANVGCSAGSVICTLDCTSDAECGSDPNTYCGVVVDASQRCGGRSSEGCKCMWNNNTVLPSNPTHYGQPPSCKSGEIHEHWNGVGLSCNPLCHPRGNLSSCPVDTPPGVSAKIGCGIGSIICTLICTSDFECGSDPNTYCGDTYNASKRCSEAPGLPCVCMWNGTAPPRVL